MGESFVAEISAVICALSMLDTYVENITIFTDQISLINRISNSSQDLTSKLYAILEEVIDNTKCKKIRFKYVKSHAGNTYHNLADNLANLGRKTI